MDRLGSRPRKWVCSYGLAKRRRRGVWSWLVPGNLSGGDVAVKKMQTVRDHRSDLTEADGVGASGGWVNGRDVYEWVDFITDDTPCATCGPDGAVGYLDRWIGNANPSYEHAITYFEGVMKGYGLDSVEVHRFQSNTAWAVNICGYKTGSVYPDEWLIFGAHFDIAPLWLTHQVFFQAMEQGMVLMTMQQVRAWC